MKNENKLQKTTKMWLKNINWIIIAILLFYSLGNCTAPKNVRSKIKSGFVSNTTQTQKNNNQPKQNKLINNEILDEQTESISYNTSDNINISTNNNTNPSTQIRIPTIREQLNQLQVAQNQTNAKVTYLEEELNTIKSDIQDIKKAIILLKGEPLQDALAGEQLTNPNISYEKVDVNKDKSIVLPDNNVENTPKNEKKIAPQPKTKKKVETKKNNDLIQKQSNKENNIIKTKENEEKSSEKNGTNINFALNSISKKEYEEAISELNNILSTEQNKEKIALCNYWLGEAYYALGQYDKAISHLQRVLNNPSSTKKVEAQALLAEAYMRFGQVTEAKKIYEELLEKYPKSQLSIRARKMLQQL